MTKKDGSDLGANWRLFRPRGWQPIIRRIENGEIKVGFLGQDEESLRQQDLVMHLSNFVTLLHLAKECHQFYTESDYVRDRHSSWTPWIMKGRMLAMVERTCSGIENPVLRDLCQSFWIPAKALDEINDQWRERLAIFFKMPMPRTDEEYRNLRKKLDLHRRKARPVWIEQAEFQPLIAQLYSLILETEHLWQQLYRYLEEQFSEILLDREEISGDQRAKDLLDRASGEPNPRKAIRLAERALQYGQIGRYASDAYFELANRYTDLGEIQQAIEHYTKSIELVRHPNPLALYWRGELYFQEQQWENARQDFEGALSIGLHSPEFENAQEYLTKLQTKDV